MKKILPVFVMAVVLLSCNNNPSKGKFTVNGEVKNTTDTRVYLEELFFSDKDPQVLDSAAITNGKFVLTANALEEGLYRIRTGNDNITLTEEGKIKTVKGSNRFLFINDKSNLSFSADANDPALAGYFVNSDANHSLKNILVYADSLGKQLREKYMALDALKKQNTSNSDSTYIAIETEFNLLRDNFTKYCFQYADTAKSPMVALFAASTAPVDVSKFDIPFTNLKKRFPEHIGISGALAFIKTKLGQQQQTTNTPAGNTNIGSMAPELTMNDVNDKPFSLSQLRGKYVLVDFWASWCGPCRGENPTVVAAYNQFKNKNFTVLGVSLDNNKDAWLKAIADDHLTWQHISDLKQWSSAAVGLYGIDGIPFNVLIDPNGKIIAKELRGEVLLSTLAATLK